MNTLAYSSQKPEKVAPKVEELVRKELAATQPVPYVVQDLAAVKNSVGSILGEGLDLLLGGKAETQLFTLVFDIAQPRPTKLQVHMNKQGIGCHGGSIVFTTKLGKPVAAEVVMDNSGKFAGDTAVAGKLNANKALLKQIEKLARTKTSLGGVEITAPRLVKLVPSDGGTTLVLSTLARPRAMGFAVSLDVQEFFAVATQVEAAMG